MNFNQLTPSVMTIILPFDGIIDILGIFLLLKTNEDIETLKPGDIFSMRYSNMYKGIIKDKKGFKNSINMDIVIKEKCISVKLSKNKLTKKYNLHMCGIKKFEQSYECAELLFNKINNIQNNLDKSINIDLDDKYKNEAIDWMKSNNKLILSEIKLGIPQKVMVNYNYSLGFKINREMLCEEMRKYGFETKWIPTLHHNVIIKIPYSKDTKGKNKKHTFMVGRSGSITQSGPNEELMELVFKKFIQIISNIKHIII